MCWLIHSALFTSTRIRVNIVSISQGFNTCSPFEDNYKLLEAPFTVCDDVYVSHFFTTMRLMATMRDNSMWYGCRSWIWRHQLSQSVPSRPPPESSSAPFVTSSSHRLLCPRPKGSRLRRRYWQLHVHLMRHLIRKQQLAAQQCLTQLRSAYQVMAQLLGTQQMKAQQLRR